MRILILTLCCLLLLTFTLAHAQDATPDSADGWAIEQRCVSEATTPPDDWSFDGTILTIDDIGIHGVRADWETPRILAFTNVIEAGNWLYGGTLSPNMLWYAAAEGNSWCFGSCSGASYTIERLHVFDLNGDDPRTYFSTEWSLYYFDNHNFIDSPHIEWLDNERLLYPMATSDIPADRDEAELRVINPFAGDLQTWDSPVDPTIGHYVSPDLTRYFQYERVGETVHRYLMNATTTEPIREFASGQRLLETSMWSPDSNYFLHMRRLDDTQMQLELYDKDGNLSASLLTILADSVYYPGRGFTATWSPNSRYFIFNIGQSLADNGVIDNVTVYVVDLQEQRIIDLCLEPIDYPVWSPDSSTLAIYFEDFFSEDDWLRLLNFNDGLLYTIAYNTGFPIGWRDDD